MADLACSRAARVCVRAFYSTSAACMAEIYTEQTQVDDRQGNAGEPLMKRLYCTVDTLQRTGILQGVQPAPANQVSQASCEDPLSCISASPPHPL